MSQLDETRADGVRWWRFLPVLVFALIAAVLFLGLGGEDRDVLPSPLIDRPAPEFALESLRPGGAPFTRANLVGGEVSVVNVWASWCGPCRVEHPELMKLKEAGVPVFGVDYKDDPNNARAFLAELGDPFTLVGADRNGRVGIDWGVYGVPETFIIDKRGHIILKHVGPIQNDDLTEIILPAIEAAR